MFYKTRTDGTVCIGLSVSGSRSQAKDTLAPAWHRADFVETRNKDNRTDMVLKTVIGLVVVLAATATAHNWTYVRGALAAGNDLEQRVCTVAEAKVFCGGWVLLVPQRYLFRVPYNQAWPATERTGAHGVPTCPLHGVSMRRRSGMPGRSSVLVSGGGWSALTLSDGQTPPGGSGTTVATVSPSVRIRPQGCQPDWRLATDTTTHPASRRDAACRNATCRGFTYDNNDPNITTAVKICECNLQR